MITIDHDQYNALIADTRVLESSRKYGPSVYRTADDRIIKAFHRKRRFAPQRFSYAWRFARNARRLQRRGFRSVTIEALYRCPERGTELAVYPMLAGSTLRELASTEHGRRALEELPAFLAGLQASGVHFRAIHLGNLLYSGQRKFALIDVSFMRFFPWSLDIRSRASNFRNILRYEEDVAILTEFGFTDFMDRYFEAAAMTPARRAKLAALIARDPLPTAIRDSLEQISRQPVT